MLSQRLRAPSAVKSVIDGRLDLVDLFYASPEFTTDFRSVLSRYCSMDTARALQKLRSTQSSPWHLGVILSSLEGFEQVQKVFSEKFESLPVINYGVADIHRRLADWALPMDLASMISTLLVSNQDLPKTFDRPGLLDANCNQDLQQAKLVFDHMQEQQQSLIQSLKDQYFCDVNNVSIRLDERKPLGPYVEVEMPASAKLNPLDANPDFHHLQTLGGSGRFKKRRYRHVPWTILHAETESAYQRYFDVEKAAFRYLTEQVTAHGDMLVQCAHLVAELDVASTLALRARECGYVRPNIITGLEFSVHQGRHPVLDHVMTAQGRTFRANDCALYANERDASTWILTGPNMGGKSTFLRQNALMAVMAQMGSFVPAASATIGVIDRLFSRVGSSDDVTRNESSFMVEMMESAYILKRATPRSLVIMDEVGRGTGARDGYCLAWAILNHLHQRGTKLLFSTHYHRLAEKASECSRMACYRMRVVQQPNDSGGVLFTHIAEPGVGWNSYGIHVAKLAGLPPSVTDEATRIFEQEA